MTILIPWEIEQLLKDMDFGIRLGGKQSHTSLVAMCSQISYLTSQNLNFQIYQMNAIIV